MKVAKKPATRCQSMWQWNAQTRIGSWSAKGSVDAHQLGDFETLIWVVRYKAKGHVTPRVDFNDVATYRRCWGVDGFSTVDAGVGGGALHYLEVVAVYMQGMAAAVEVVDHYFNDVEII